MLAPLKNMLIIGGHPPICCKNVCVCVCHHRHQPDQGKKIPAIGLPPHFDGYLHGSLNVPIEHHPTIRYMVYNGYYKVMSNIPKMDSYQPPLHPQYDP